MGRTTCDLVEHIHHLDALLKNRMEISLPRGFTDSLHSFVVFFFSSGQLWFRNDAVLYHPCAHPANAIELIFPFESFRRFVSFLASRSGMALRLSHFNDMDQLWDVIFACDLGRVLIGFDQRGIIPAAHLIQIVTALAFLFHAIVALEAF